MPTHFWLPPQLVKTDKPLEWPITEECADMLQLWITRFRPILCAPGNPYLFGGEDDLPMSEGGFANTLVAVVLQRIGVRVNMHLMRHFAAWLYLKLNPGAYEMVSKILGHASVEMTKKFYTGLEIDAAAEHFDATVMGERAATRIEAEAALTPRSKRRSPQKEGKPSGGW